jgi:hypothetical protein
MAQDPPKRNRTPSEQLVLRQTTLVAGRCQRNHVLGRASTRKRVVHLNATMGVSRIAVPEVPEDEPTNREVESHSVGVNRKEVSRLSPGIVISSSFADQVNKAP